MNLDLKEKEEVIEIIKKTFLVVVPALLKGIILSLPAIYLLFYLDNSILNIISFVWLIILASYIFYHWLNWHLDYYVITNERVIESKNFGFFSRHFAEMPLERIDNSKCDVKGFFGTVLGYGNVVVYSISKATIILEKIKEPRRIQNLISEVKEKYLK